MKSIKEFVKCLITIPAAVWYGLPLLCLVPAKLFRKFWRNSDRFITRILAVTFAKLFSRFSRYYCMIEFLPKKAEDITPCSLLTDTKNNEYAVVIQGPVNEFTAESVRVYRKIFPKAVIIVSTWVNTDERLAAELRGLADDVLLNEPPKTSGLLNVNYQAKSSYAGIRRAYELGIPYVMKTRSDQRIYTPLMFEYFKSLLEVFPLDGRYSQWQKERIITDSGSHISKQYFIRDFFYFGTSQDLMNFFDFPPDPINYRGMTTEDWGKYLFSLKKWLDADGIGRIQISPEIQLTKSYIKRFGPEGCESTLKNFWEDVKGRFLMVSRSELRTFWDRAHTRHCLNFWNIGQTWDGHPEADADRYFITPLWLSLVKGHLLYDPKLEEAHKHDIEPFHNLGSFCNGYEFLDEVVKDIPLLRGDG